MTKDDFIKIYCAQYKILEDNVIELSKYVTIDPANYATFSLQLHTLFISICSEIDSLTGEFCKKINEDEKDVFNILDKIKTIMRSYPNLKNWRVETKFPFTKDNFVPFTNLEYQKHSWWTDYNAVKHNRTEKYAENRYNYQKATLKNVLYSMAALYLLLLKLTKVLNIEENFLNSQLFEAVVSE